MKKGIAMVLAVIIVIVYAVSLSGCGNESDKISNLITEFEYACNSLDVDAILDCIHPDITNKVKTAMGIVGLFTGQDSDDMLEAISESLTNNSKVDAESFFSTIKIDVKEVNSDNNNGTAKVNLTYRVGTEEIVSDATFVCSKYNDKWYITSFKF